MAASLGELNVPIGSHPELANSLNSQDFSAAASIRHSDPFVFNRYFIGIVRACRRHIAFFRSRDDGLRVSSALSIHLLLRFCQSGAKEKTSGVAFYRLKPRGLSMDRKTT
jgi:hypothetical protein